MAHPARIERIFKFDRDDERFELYENESGEPPVFRSHAEEEAPKEERKHGLPSDISSFGNELSEAFSSDINKDLITRDIIVCGEIKALIAYLNGMADASLINDFVLRPLMELTPDKLNETDQVGLSKRIINSAVQISEVTFEKDMQAVTQAVMDGMTVLFIEGADECVLLETRGFEKRAIGTAENEKVVFGPKESFNESLRTNVTLIRRLLRTEDLVVETRKAGGMNNTSAALIYRSGFTDPRLVSEMKRRLSKVKVNNVLSAGVIEQLIEEKSIIPIPKTLSTERPDRAVSHIMNGCVCLLIEGSPFAVLAPVTLDSLMTSSEDIYLRAPLGSVLRIIRYAGAIISVLLPGYFLSLALYHQGALTTEVLSTVTASRKMVFEPIAAEMILLLFVFQLIREAGLRVPGSIGQAIGIIGGLIMGQAAVAANLASSVVLIIVALSGLGNFCIPDYSAQIAAAYLRLSLVLAAWLGGLLAVSAAMLAFVAATASCKSFGVPFLSPFAPKTNSFRPKIFRGNIGCVRAEDIMNTSDDGRIAARKSIGRRV